LANARYEKFRRMGTYLETMEDGSVLTHGHSVTS